MPFKPENSLEKSLVRAFEDPDHRLQFYQEFLAADILVIHHGDPPVPEGRTVLEEDTELVIEKVEVEGASYIPVFSSLPRLEEFVEDEANYLQINAREFLEITRGAELLLNPASDYSKEFTRDEIQALLDGTPQGAGDEGIQVMIGEPRVYPDKLATALQGLFQGLPQVARAWLAHFYDPSDGLDPHTLVGIEVDGDFDPVLEQALQVAGRIEVPDPPVDFIRVLEEDGIGEYFLQESQPFYTK